MSVTSRVYRQAKKDIAPKKGADLREAPAGRLTSERILSRCAALGKETEICLGIRLRNAGSISWILFVAPKIKI